MRASQLEIGSLERAEQATRLTSEMQETSTTIAADGAEQLRMTERLTLGGPPKQFAAQIGWTTFGSCLGACLGVVLTKAPGWWLLLTLVAVPFAAVGVALLAWRLARTWAMWVVKMAWDDWHSDPCGTAPACPECGEVWVFNTLCCDHFALGEPTVEEDGTRACSACGADDPMYQCCGRPWVRQHDTYIQGHGVMTERDWMTRPARWPNWRPGVRDVIRWVLPRRPI